MISRRRILALPSALLQAAPDLRVEVRQITRGPKHHFFGYIGHVQNIPWNRSGRYIIGLQSAFQERMPAHGEAANIVLIDTANNNKLEVVEQTRAWNFQQGTMLYWNPDAQETQFFFNDRDPKTQRVFCVLYDVASRKRLREYRFDDTPIGNGGVAQKGGYYFAINYGRMARLRPVTGYPGAFDWAPEERHPSNDGVFRIDIATGRKRLLVSFQQLAAVIRKSRPDVDQIPLFINHTLSNRDNTRVFFFARGDFAASREKRIDFPFLMNPDGSGLTPMRHIGGHPEWESGMRMLGQIDNRQVIYDTASGQVAETLADPDVFPVPGGDISLSPDGKWLVNGYGMKDQNQYVFYRRADRQWVRSRAFNNEGWMSGDLRNDPAPCWNRQSNQILFPAFSEDLARTRQMWMATIHS